MALTIEAGMVYIEPGMVYQIDVGGDARGAPARSRQTTPPQTAIAQR
jgi:hypothetical protein